MKSPAQVSIYSCGSESLRHSLQMQQRKVDNAHAAQVSYKAFPGPKIPSRLMLVKVESPMLLLRCRLTLQQREVDLGVG